VGLSQTNRRRPHQEVIGVVFKRRVIFVVMKAELDVVSAPQKILTIQIRHQHLVDADSEADSAHYWYLLRHRKIRGVVLIPIPLQIAKHARAGLLIVKEEPTEIAIESLCAGANRNRIERLAQAPQPCFENASCNEICEIEPS